MGHHRVLRQRRRKPQLWLPVSGGRGQLQHLHGNAAPFGNASPALNAVMHGDVLDLAQLLDIGKRKSTGFSTRPPTSA